MVVSAKYKLNYFWNSPTLMTWLSYSTKSLSLFGVLPLVLKQFSPEEIVLWYLFSTIISLQGLADFGFRQTFTRIISFAYGGAKTIDIISDSTKIDFQNKYVCNESLLTSIVSTMMYLYKRLSYFAIILMVTIGTWSLIKPISDVTNPFFAWVSWGVIILTTTISFFSKVYLNFLEGLNKIAVVRKIETITSLGSIISCIGVLLYSPSLLNLVLVNQFWVLVNSFRDQMICYKVENGLFGKVNLPLPIDKKLLNKIWAPAWRSGIGGLMSAGIINLVSIIYAQFGNTSSVASYLLAIRILTQIKEVSMAPFYSKLPLLIKYRVNNDIDKLKDLIKKGMRMSHLVFFVGFVGVALFIEPLLSLINSRVPFVSLEMWALLGLAYFAHRFGAMHIQVYLTTNHVISHIAEGVSGVIFIATLFLLHNYLGIYSIPLGLLISYICFFCWYATVYSYRSLGVKSFWEFEKSVSIPSIFGLIIFSIIVLIIHFIPKTI